MIYIIIIVIIIIITPITQIYLIRRRTKPVGQMIITVDERGKKLFSLELDKNPDEIANMHSIVFKVVNMLEDDSE